MGKENWQAYSKNTLLGKKEGTYLGKKEWTIGCGLIAQKKSKTAKDYLFLIRDKSATQQTKISKKYTRLLCFI